MQLQNSKLLSLGFNLLLALAVVVSVVTWFSFEPQKINLDGDEVVWVLDAEVYEKYANGEWNFFSISPEAAQSYWHYPEHRIVDQPQAGKYFLGFFLSLANLHPWQSANKLDLYIAFTTSNLPDGSLENAKDGLGDDVYHSILLIRRLHTFLGFGAILLFVASYYFYAKDGQLSALFFIVLLNHAGIAEQFKLATVDLYSLVFQFLFVVAVITGLSKISKDQLLKNQTKFIKIVAWGAFAGSLLAVATSIKLNGAFLVFIPYLLFIFSIGRTVYIDKKIDKQQIFVSIAWLVSMFISGGLVFLLLEPELWSNPIQNLTILLDARLLQQQRFLNFGGTASLWQMVQILGKVIRQLPTPVGFLYVLFLLKNSLVLKKNILNLAALKSRSQQRLLLIGALIIIGATFYYGRVGFERYFYPATIALYSISVIMMTKRTNDV